MKWPSGWTRQTLRASPSTLFPLTPPLSSRPLLSSTGEPIYRISECQPKRQIDSFVIASRLSETPVNCLYYKHKTSFSLMAFNFVPTQFFTFVILTYNVVKLWRLLNMLSGIEGRLLKDISLETKSTEKLYWDYSNQGHDMTLQRAAFIHFLTPHSSRFFVKEQQIFYRLQIGQNLSWHQLAAHWLILRRPTKIFTCRLVCGGL